MELLTRSMAAVVVVVAVLSIYLPTTNANVFSALRRGFEHQEEISYKATRSGAGGEFEEKEVPGKTWACTLQKDPNESQLSVFSRLFGYLDGANDRNEHIPMGIPVSIEAKGTKAQRTLTACFFLPEKVQANPPAPTSSRVFLVQRPPITILTRQFGGFATSESVWDGEADELKRMVAAAGVKFDPNVAYWNAYDPPLKLLGRRNEVWLVKVA